MVVALWQFFKGVKKLSGYSLEEIMHDPKAEASKTTR